VSSPSKINKRLYAIRHVFGSSPWVSFLLLVALGIVVNGLYDLIKIFVSKKCPGFSDFIAFIPFALIALYAFYRYRRAGKIRVRMVEIEPLPQAHALIIFLSIPAHNDGKSEFYYRNGWKLGKALEHARNKNHNWYMPLVGLNAHLHTLKRIYIIPSEDDGPGKPGSHNNVGEFIDLVRNLWPFPESCPVIRPIGEEIPVYSKGVNYENVALAARAADDAFLELRRYYNPAQIIIDITAGKKTSSVSGAAMALAQDAQFQYVSTANYKVRVFRLQFTMRD